MLQDIYKIGLNIYYIPALRVNTHAAMDVNTMVKRAMVPIAIAGVPEIVIPVLAVSVTIPAIVLPVLSIYTSNTLPLTAGNCSIRSVNVGRVKRKPTAVTQLM